MRITPLVFSERKIARFVDRNVTRNGRRNKYLVKNCQLRHILLTRFRENFVGMSDLCRTKLAEVVFWENADAGRGRFYSDESCGFVPGAPLASYLANRTCRFWIENFRPNEPGVAALRQV